MEDVITGQEFSRATNMPARWLVDQASISAPVPMSERCCMRLAGRQRMTPGQRTIAVTFPDATYSLTRKQRFNVSLNVLPHQLAAVHLTE
jgi:hypothetical protein